MKIGIGVSLHRDPGEAAIEAVRQAKEAVPHPSFALAFGAVVLDQKKIHAALCQELDPEILFGGSSYAEITNAGVTKGSVAVLLMEFDDVPVKVGGAVLGKSSEEALADILKGTGEVSIPEEALPLVLFFASLQGEYDNAFLRSLSSHFRCAPIFGGICSTNYDLGMSHPDFWTNIQYAGSELRKDAVRMAMLALPKEDYNLGFGFETGWEPVAPPVTLTRAEEERVFEVDGQPVVDFYRQFLGREQSPEFFELMVQRYAFALDLGVEGAPPVLKLPVKVNFDEGWIRFIPSEPLQGKRVRLIQASRRGAVEGAQRAARNAKEALGDWEPALVLVVSCCTRNMVLHSRLDAELEAVRGVFGETVPVFGYYSGGEILPFLSQYEEVADLTRDFGGSRYHAGTIGILALGSRKAPAGIHVPKRVVQLEGLDTRAKRLSGLLSASEKILDDTETFLANLSRKSFRDGEKIQKQAEIIHRYTPHDVWEAVGRSVEEGRDDLYDADFEGGFMFLDVKGFTSYSEKHGSKEVVAVLNEIFEPTTEIIYRCGGDVDKFIGDCIFAAFRDPEKAIDAGEDILDMFQMLKERGNPFEVRIGINSGRAVRANVGTKRRREYTFIGDAVNTAQRLEGACTPGKMLVCERLFKRVEARFRNAVRREVDAKGKKAAIVAYEI